MAALPLWRAAYASTHSNDAATPRPHFVSVAVPQNVLELALRVIESADHAGLPFAIIDKQAARIVVYRSDGTLAGVSAALLGQTPGDQSVPGVGERAQSGSMVGGDRTTPAGRFDSEPGRNLSGEPVVWIDYASALAIHRLRAGPSRQKRAMHLATASVSDKRLTDGCVVVPPAFYLTVVQPTLGLGRSVVYVMPEDRTWNGAWRDFAARGL